MGFYDEISKYYDYIFPVGEAQIKFIMDLVGSPPKRILDVACGSGAYSLELAGEGYRVSAVDFEREMVNKAKDKASKAELNVDIFQCDMRKLDDVFKEENYFDCIFCIGNSIVHLGSLEEILTALKQMYGLLKTDGILILQIINYDRIVKHGINSLPPLKNEEIGLDFTRGYEYFKDKNLINFNTVLTINKGTIHEQYENSIELIPVVNSNMLTLLKETGFSKVELFGDFNYSPYDEDSYMLVINAVK